MAEGPSEQKGFLTPVKGSWRWLLWPLPCNDGITNGWSAFRRATHQPFCTCEPVWRKPAFHLQNVPLVLAMIGEGLIALSFDCLENLPQLFTLARRYAYWHPTWRISA